MDFNFDYETLQPPVSYLAEDSTYNLRADMLESTTNPPGTDFEGCIAPNLSLGFANPVEEAPLSEQFGYELFDMVPIDLDLSRGELLESGFGRPQDTTSTLNNSRAVHAPLPFHQQAGIALFDNNLAISSPRRERIEDATLLLSNQAEPANDFQLHNPLALDSQDAQQFELFAPESRSRANFFIAQNATGNEYTMTDTRAYIPAIMDASTMSSGLHSFPPIVSAQPMEPRNSLPGPTCHYKEKLKEPTPHDWDELRPIVCYTLRYKYGFKVSEKMLKVRLRKWDRGKNIKSEEKKAISRQLRTRESDHKRSEVYVRGTIVPAAKVKRYEKTLGLTPHDEVDGMKSPTLPAYEIRTPPASPLSAPRSLRIPEELMKSLRNYILGAFEEKIWVSVGDLDTIESREGRGDEGAELQEAIKMAFGLFQSGRISDVKRSMSGAEMASEAAIKKQDTRLIPNMLAIIRHYSRSKHSDFTRLTIKHWSSTAIKIFGHDHGLTRLIHWALLLLREAENTSLLTGLERAWISVIDSMKLALDPLHLSLLSYRFVYIEHVIFTRDPEKALSILRHLQSIFDNKFCGSEDIRPCLVRLRLATWLAREECRQYKEAIAIATDIVERSKRPGFPSNWVDWYQSEAYSILGYSRTKLDQDLLGGSNLRKALRIRLKAWGTQDARTLSLARRHESWRRHRFRNGTAEEVNPDWQTTLEYASEDDDSDVMDGITSDVSLEEDSDKHYEDDSEVVNEGKIGAES